MAWRAALTRDAEYVTVGDDVSANEAGVDFTNYTEEENEPAYDSNSEEDTDRSQQHTSRHPNRDGAMSAGSNRTRPTVTSASGTRPNSRGAKSRPASSKSRPMSKGSKYSHLRPGSGGIGVDEQDQILLQGTGHDIALHLLPSRPGVGQALYSDWCTEEFRPNLTRLNVIDYMHGDDGDPTAYQEDEYYEGANIKAEDYWTLKRIGRQIRAGSSDATKVFDAHAAENLLRIDMLVPSRQVKFDAGGRIRKAVRRHVWWFRRRKAAVKIQATYRMHLTKFVKRKAIAERRARAMEEDFRGQMAREREEKRRAEEKKKAEDDERAARKKQEMAERAATASANAAADAEAARLEELQARAAAEDDGSEAEEEGEQEEPEEVKTPRSAEIQRKLALLKETGMPKAELNQMRLLLRKQLDPNAQFSEVEKMKLEMLQQIVDTDNQNREMNAKLIQAFWRGKMQRRALALDKEKMRIAAKMQRDNTMAAMISKVYRGHVGRRIFRYAMHHANRRLRIARVVQNEGTNRATVQRRIESKRKQLDIAVTIVQRCFRGHLGRRRFVAQCVFAWELKIHVAAQRIQRMYRDALDRQWARYVGQGNLQMLVGQQAARELRRIRRLGTAAAPTKQTLKPPIKKNYSTRTLKGVSTLADGVPLRHLDPYRKGKKELPMIPPSMPDANNIRQRWGMADEFTTLDEVSKNIVLASRRLKKLVDAGGIDRERESMEAADRSIHAAEASGLDPSVVGTFEGGAATGVDAYKGASTRPWSQEGLRLAELTGRGGGGKDDSYDSLEEEELQKVLSLQFGTTGRTRGGSDEDDDDDGGLDTPPETVPSFKEVFGTEVERFHIAPGQSQIMPSYLRLQYREEATKRKVLHLASIGDMEAAAKVKKKNRLGGKLLDLARARDEQYTAGKVQVHRDLGRVEWQEESEDEEEAMGLDMLLETKRQQHHQRFGNLALPGTKLVMNLRKMKAAQRKAERSRSPKKKRPGWEGL